MKLKEYTFYPYQYHREEVSSTQITNVYKYVYQELNTTQMQDYLGNIQIL